MTIPYFLAKLEASTLRNLENKIHGAENVLHFASEIEAKGASVHTQAMQAKAREHADCFGIAGTTQGLRVRERSQPSGSSQTTGNWP